MNHSETTEIRNKRILAALNMEEPDRIPIMLSGQMYYKYIDPTMVIADYWRRPKLVDDYLIQAHALPIFNEIDSAPVVGIPMDLPLQKIAAKWFARLKVPGRDLSENSIWQIDERGPMTEEDYDTIINKGWPALKKELHERTEFDPDTLPAPDLEYKKEMDKKVAELGKASIGRSPADLPYPPFEVLCSARKMGAFFRDLRRMPDKVRAALDIMDQEEVDNTVNALKSAPGEYGFIGGTRLGSEFIAQKIFEKFYFPYFDKLIPAMQSVNTKTWLHMDGIWDSFLHYFTKFPKGQCIWDPDHMTDNTKLKEILGDTMCITGNVPPSILSVGTPDECYEYTMENIEIFGQSGFIMSAACAVPPNAKRENIEAVILATLGK